MNSACAYQTNDLSSFLMRILSFVQINLHGCWPCAWLKTSKERHRVFPGRECLAWGLASIFSSYPDPLKSDPARSLIGLGGVFGVFQCKTSNPQNQVTCWDILKHFTSGDKVKYTYNQGKYVLLDRYLAASSSRQSLIRQTCRIVSMLFRSVWNWSCCHTINRSVSYR